MGSESDPLVDYHAIKNELKSYNVGLTKHPSIIAASKMDEEGSKEKLKQLKRGIRKVKIFPISALTHEGINEMLYECARLLQETPVMPLEVPVAASRLYEAKQGQSIFEIHKKSDHTFIITGERVLKTYRLINTTTDEGMLKLLAYLERSGSKIGRANWKPKMATRHFGRFPVRILFLELFSMKLEHYLGVIENLSATN
ncbi:MAG: DUF1967 domain-containing protein [Anaerotruncus sp.]|nr:DUF1967 domain-containing protein [Anaerotruncus sp.]